MKWTEQNNALETAIIFKDFSQAMAFIVELGILAEKLDHHPTWTNTWNKLNISLNTHSSGNIVTDKDINMSKAISKIYERYRKD